MTAAFPAARILDVVASINPANGGIAEGVTRLGEAYRRLGRSHKILSLDHAEDPWVKNSNAEVIALGADSLNARSKRNFLPWTRYRYSKLLTPWLMENAKYYDAVILNGLWNYSSLGSWQALKRLNVPFFVFPHGMLDPWFRKNYPLKHAAKQLLWLYSEGRILKHARLVFFTTEEERSLARDAFIPYNITEKVVGYGSADIPENKDDKSRAFLQRFPALQERRYLLFLGRIHPKKGCDILISAFGKLAKLDGTLDLVIAGPDQIGWKARLSEAALQAGIEDRLHWVGMLESDLKWGALLGCEAFVLPSHQENFGVSVAEALACGKPVITTNKVNIWREVCAAGAGFISDDTQTSYDQALESFLLTGAEDRQAMGMAARRLFDERFEIGKAANVILEALDSELSRG
jgi:glycosyltransferase involved in cell wall biosynthesis